LEAEDGIVVVKHPNSLAVPEPEQIHPWVEEYVIPVGQGVHAVPFLHSK
jgi:hypothetical protein